MKQVSVDNLPESLFISVTLYNLRGNFPSSPKCLRFVMIVAFKVVTCCIYENCQAVIQFPIQWIIQDCVEKSVIMYSVLQ